jgi:hypothetical protein
MLDIIKIICICLPFALAVSCGDDPSGPGSGPTASELTVGFTGDSSSCEVTVNWTICPDGDFANYVLYRSESPSISSSPDSALVLCSFSEANQNGFVDSTLAWNTLYYYALRTSDTEDQFSWSNEGSVLTPSGGSGQPFLFLDSFTFPDGSNPSFWIRTGGTGDGVYQVMNNTFAHVSGTHCSYYRWEPGNTEFGTGIYEFDVYGPYWEFAWRISTSSSAEGTCNRLGHYPNWWPGYFIMLGAQWSGSDYSWQSSSWGDHYVYECPDPVGLHHVTIQDNGTTVVVHVDSEEIFSLSYSGIPEGTVGFGAGDTAGSAPDYIPWCDNLSFDPEE